MANGQELNDLTTGVLAEDPEDVLVGLDQVSSYQFVDFFLFLSIGELGAIGVASSKFSETWLKGP